MAKEKGGKRAMAPAIEKETERLVAPILEKFGCTLWDVRFEKDGAMWYLRVLFDKDGGLDSDECEEISRPINEILDKQKFIEQTDILEAGTPGLSRRLRKPEHFREYLGERVSAQVKTENGETFIRGVLKEYDEENAAIAVDDRRIKLSKCLKVTADDSDEYAEEQNTEE